MISQQSLGRACHVPLCMRQSQTGLRISQRRAVLVRAEKDDDPKLSFKSNDRAGLGFTESDSAGQTNIFAVEPKSYVQGSKNDGTSDAQDSTQGGAAIAGTVAVGAVVAGLILLSGGDPDVVSGPEAGLKPLSEYASQFAQEVSSRSSASAPEIVDM